MTGFELKNTANKKKFSADEIAEKTMSGEDITPFLTNKGQMKPAIQRVNADFCLDMLIGLDALAIIDKKIQLRRCPRGAGLEC